MFLDRLTELLARHFRPVLSLIILGVVVALGHLLLENFASQWPQLTLAIIAFLLLIAITFLLFTLLEGVNALGPLAPRITYYDVFGEQGRSVLFEEAKKIIASAQREILVLNWSAEEEFGEDVLASRADYYQKLAECSEKLVYKRVIQSDSYWRNENTPTIADTFEVSYVKHFEEMLAVQAEQQQKRDYHKTELLVVPPRIPSTFLIADDDYLIWQLNQVGERKPGERYPWHIRGAIVIHDPVGNVIRHFKGEFERAQSQHRPLEKSDLQKTKPKRSIDEPSPSDNG